MDFLNSQHLTPQDGYAHPFPKPGEFTYSALISDMNQPAASGTIIVAGQGVPEGKGKQYDIVFHWDPGARRFIPRESDIKLTLQPNDFVVFHFEAAVPGQPPCFILIRGKEAVEGDSRRLKTHDAFTHFFLNPGEYAYRLGKTTYRISVADHRSMSEEEHQRQVQQPLVIMVNGTDVKVPHGRMVAGQSAIWAIERGESVHIESIVGEPKQPSGDGQPTAARRKA
jgi:hypothetical protein